MRKLSAILLALALLCGCAVGPNYKQPPVTGSGSVPGSPGSARSGRLARRPALVGDLRRREVESADRRGPRHGLRRPDSPSGASRRPGRGPGSRARSSGPQVVLQRRVVLAHAAVDLRAPVRPLDAQSQRRQRQLRLGARPVGPHPPIERGRQGPVPGDRGSAQGSAAFAGLGRRAITYFQLRELDEELAIAKKTEEAFKETADLFERKLSEGAASALETSYATAAYNQVASAVPEIERQIEATENALNVLLGRNPAPIARGRALAGSADASRGAGRTPLGSAPAPARHPPGRAAARLRQCPASVSRRRTSSRRSA